MRVPREPILALQYQHSSPKYNQDDRADCSKGMTKGTLFYSLPNYLIYSFFIYASKQTIK